MTAADVDRYLAGLGDTERAALEHLRGTLRELLPGAEEAISYGMPAFKVDGTAVAGFAAFKRHLSYFPHSGRVLSALADELAGYESTSGSLHFPVDEPLPKELVAALVATRLREIGERGGAAR